VRTSNPESDTFPNRVVAVWDATSEVGMESWWISGQEFSKEIPYRQLCLNELTYFLSLLTENEMASWLADPTWPFRTKFVMDKVAMYQYFCCFFWISWRPF
jgi:hypothetical protein